MAPASLVILLLYGVVGLVVAFFVSATLFRFAIKIVAHFTPGYANILFTYVAVGVAIFAASIAMRIAGLSGRGTIGATLFQIAIFYIVTILVYAVTIKDKSGRSLGIFNALLASLLRSVFTALLAALLFAAAICFFGRPTALNFVNTEIRQGEAVAATMQAAAAQASARATATPSDIPTAEQLLQQPPPGPARYYLKDPITIIVAYGQMTYPANTEVHLISQNGDNCEIQIANKTYTVSRSQLVTVQP